MDYLRNILKAAFIVQLLLCVLASGDAKLVEVTEANWERLLSTNEWMIELYKYSQITFFHIFRLNALH